MANGLRKLIKGMATKRQKMAVIGGFGPKVTKWEDNRDI